MTCGQTKASDHTIHPLFVHITLLEHLEYTHIHVHTSEYSTCMHVLIHAYTYIRMYIHIHAYIYINTHTIYVHVHTYYIHIYMYICVLYIYTYIHITYISMCTVNSRIHHCFIRQKFKSATISQHRYNVQVPMNIQLIRHTH